MNKTVRLYDADAYTREFSAKVLSCEPRGDSRYDIITDATAFFPEEGGQCCDKGILGNAKVLHVAIREGVIFHTTDIPLTAGEKVNGKIDFALRYRNMQNHSGEHIVSGLIHKMYGLTNVGFHLGSHDMTMDYNGVLSDEQLCEIEDAANFAIYENLEIIAKYPEKTELDTLQYRSKLDISDGVRIVTIPGYDICACCAPHVARTGEIGMIKFVEVEKYKGGIRIHAHCGSDALADYREKNRTAGELSALLSVKKHEIADAVQRLLSENLKLKAENAEMTTRYCKSVAGSLAPSDNIICIFEKGVGSPGLRTIANGLVTKCPAVIALDEKQTGEYSFILASSDGMAKTILCALAAKFDTKGGGSDKMVQGTMKGTECDISAFLKAYKINMN